jgi:hypothetical protein
LSQAGPRVSAFGAMALVLMSLIFPEVSAITGVEPVTSWIRNRYPDLGLLKLTGIALEQKRLPVVIALLHARPFPSHAARLS